MEITKNGDKRSDVIEKAKQEFEEFKTAQRALPAAVNAAGMRTEKQSERLLFCSTHIGPCMRLALKLTSDTAEIIGIRKASITVYAESNAVPAADAALLKRHLVLGAFKGCLFCGSDGIVRCNQCDTLSCIGPDENKHRCPNCSYVAPLSMTGISLAFEQPGLSPRGAANPDRKQLEDKRPSMLLTNKR